MGSSSQTKISSSLPVFVILALLGGAYYFARSPLESSRPEAPGDLQQPATESEMVEARLWQDPLQAALSHAKSLGDCKVQCFPWKYTSGHSINQITDELYPSDPNKSSSKVRILLTIIRDGTFAEDHERRIRNRYAVLTAIGASGFVPEDSSHIRYFLMGLAKDADPFVVPFEWFKFAEIYPPDLRKDCADRVLVIWLPRSILSKEPLAELARLVDKLKEDCNKARKKKCSAKAEANKTTIELNVIGPSRSTTLRTMLKEIAKLRCRDKKGELTDLKKKLTGVKIFSPWSTASPALLAENWEQQNKTGPSLSELYDKIPTVLRDGVGVNFIRMIGSDDLLVRELICELRRRGVDPVEARDHVALICEWDTFYGKAFPLTFATMMQSLKANGNRSGLLKVNWGEYGKTLHSRKEISMGRFPPNLRTYSYIRGIDGRLPGQDKSEEEKKSQNEQSESKWNYAKNLELPIGRSQLDYARRLAKSLSDQNKRLDPNKPKTIGVLADDPSKLKAIGIVGSDVYDKLILLRALREEFDDVVFFLTDLDARFLHHEQIDWTKNVIVVSNYGLELNERYQRTVYQKAEGKLPPFRDNYQTAVFLACRAAMELPVRTPGPKFCELGRAELTAMISRPRIFEIGRGRAVDLSVSENKAGRRVNVHPSRREKFPGWETFFSYCLWIVLSVQFLTLLIPRLSEPLRAAMTVGGKKSRPNWGDNTGAEYWFHKPENEAVIRVLRRSLYFVLAFVIVAVIDHYREEGERFCLLSGVSIWPGLALRVLAAILSVCFLFKAAYKLREADDELEANSDFNLVRKDCKACRCEIRSYRKWRAKNRKKRLDRCALNPCTWWGFRKYIGIYRWRCPSDSCRLWDGYRLRGIPWNRWYRVIPMTIYFLLLSVILCSLLGLPFTPYRGKLSLGAYRAVAMACGILMMLLTFYVVDATRLCLRVVHCIAQKRNWPTDVIKAAKKGSQLKQEDVEGWLDARFVAKLTKPVVGLIYYPIAVLLVMIVSRWRFFDNWNWPTSVVLVYSIGLACALSCGFRLYLAARETRQEALKQLRGTLERIRFNGEYKERAEQIQTIIERIESLREGAFRPFLENPIIHVLLGSGSAAFVTILRFIAPS